jgi:hypothetical protein
MRWTFASSRKDRPSGTEARQRSSATASTALRIRLATETPRTFAASLMRRSSSGLTRAASITRRWRCSDLGRLSRFRSGADMESECPTSDEAVIRHAG